MPLDRGAGDDHYGASKNLDGTCKGSKTAGEPCPGSSYDTAGCLSKLFFCWVNPVTTQCLSGSVEPKELPPLSKADMTEMRRGVLDRSLRIEELTSRNPSILKATLREFWPALLTAALWSMVRETLSFANTFLLKEILKDDAGEWQGPWQQGETTILHEETGFCGVGLVPCSGGCHLQIPCKCLNAKVDPITGCILSL